MEIYKSEFAALTKLAFPIVVAQLAQTTLTFVDTLMVGSIGKDAIAGIAIGSTVFFFVFVVLAGFVLGVGPMVSQSTGAEDLETAGRATRQGLWLSLALFFPAFVLFWNVHPILLWMGQPAETSAASSAYLRAASWGILPGLGTMALRGLLEGVSNVRPIMIFGFVAIGLNVFFNNVLMFGWYGFPALGLVGTGYASSLVYTAMFLMLAIYIHFRYPELHVFSKIRSPDPRMLLEVVHIGAPIGLTLGFESSMFSAAAIGMGILGTDELAAHQIALQTASISFMVPLGLAIATSVRVGQAIGRNSPREAEVAGHVGIGLCGAVMCISAMIFWLAPQAIIGMYNIDLAAPENQDVVRLATGFLMIAGLFQVVDGLQVGASLSLRGLKDTTAVMLLSLLSYWGVGLTAGAVLGFGFNLEGNGLWLGMTLGLATAALLLSLRFQWKVRRMHG